MTFLASDSGIISMDPLIHTHEANPSSPYNSGLPSPSLVAALLRKASYLLADTKALELTGVQDLNSARPAFLRYFHFEKFAVS